jgi:hypothetical protein
MAFNNPQEEIFFAKIRFAFQILFRTISGAAVGFLISNILEININCSEADSGLCAAFIWTVVVPLGILTLAFVWGPYVKASYLAYPWYLLLNMFFSESTATTIGLMINGAIISLLLAYLKVLKQGRKAH